MYPIYNYIVNVRRKYTESMNFVIVVMLQQTLQKVSLQELFSTNHSESMCHHYPNVGHIYNSKSLQLTYTKRDVVAHVLKQLFFRGYHQNLLNILIVFVPIKVKLLALKKYFKLPYHPFTCNEN